MILELNNLTKKYETENFIFNDPIQFPHRYKNIENIEISGFLASIFAYGNRQVFINKLNELFSLMQNDPLNYILNSNFSEIKNFNYRFAKDF